MPEFPRPSLLSVPMALMLAAALLVSPGPAARPAAAAQPLVAGRPSVRPLSAPAPTPPPALPAPLSPQDIGSEWQPFVPGVLGYVQVMASDGANIYVGGHFTQAGGLPVSNIARWNINTQQWSDLGGGVTGPGYFTAVNAIALSGQDVYVAGDFAAAGGLAANYIARWNTTTSTWHPLGSGLDRPVQALLAAAGTLYVGGQFGNAGGAPAPGLAQWNLNSQAWSTVGSGANSGVHGYVYALALTGTDLYVGGAFDRAGVISTTNIALWQGASWSTLGLGTDANLSDVQSLAISGTTVYAGGAFASVSDGVVTTPASNLAAWNTTQHTWSALGAGVAGGSFTAVTNLALGPQGLYAAGFFTQAGAGAAHNTARWDGSQWLPLQDALDAGEGLDDGAGALSVVAGQVYLGGSFKNAGIRSALGLARWDPAGQHWYTLGNGVNSYLTALAVSGDDVYLGGDFTSAGGLPAGHIAHWNRRANTWSNLNGGVSGCRKTGSACTTSSVNSLVISGTDVYAGGNFSAAGGLAANGLARWDTLHNQWTALGAGISCATPLCYPTIYALFANANGLYAGGAFDHAGSGAANNVALWNGSAWSTLGAAPGGVNGPVYALAGLGATLYAGGQFSAPAANLAAFDGASWSAVGQPLNNSVSALAFIGTDLYVGGQFTNAGGSGPDYLALLGSSGDWLALSGAVNNPVYALAAQGTTLLVGGAFTQTGNLVTNHVALFDSAQGQWQALNYGVDAVVRAVAPNADGLYVGGDFANTDGLPGYYFTRWGPGSATVGGFSASGPDCLALYGSYIGCVVTGADGHAWLKEFANGAWTQWIRANLDPTQFIQDGPSLTAWGTQTAGGRPSRVNIFARASNDYVLQAYWDTGTWTNWRWYPGAPLASSSLDCVSWAADRNDCFYRTLTTTTLSTLWTSGAVDYGFGDLGGAFTSGAAASTWAAGHLDVFGRGTDNLLYHTYYEGAWHGWASPAAGTIASDPDCVSRAFGLVDCVALGQNGQVLQLAYNGSAWSGYVSLGGVFRAGPTVASLGPDNLNVFAWGQDCHFYQRSWTTAGGWSAWVDLGGDARVTGLCNQLFLPLVLR